MKSKPVIVKGRTLNLASPFVRDLAITVAAAVDIDANKDGKVDPGEYLGFGQVLLSSIFRNFSSAPEAIREISQKTSTEFQELKLVFVEGFDLENDKAEEFVERGFSVALDLYSLVRDIGDNMKAA
jgi:hypothetical protein